MARLLPLERLGEVTTLRLGEGAEGRLTAGLEGRDMTDGEETDGRETIPGDEARGADWAAGEAERVTGEPYVRDGAADHDEDGTEYDEGERDGEGA